MSLTEISVRGVRKPIVRYVYLVQDLSDAARMGGVPENTYTTYQAAYNAANTLQLLVGGNVVILVGNTTSASVGACSTPTWNANVSLVGISSLVSRIGATSITTVSAINIRVKNIGIGGITSEGGITINMENSQILLGTLNASSTTGNGGNITVSASNSNCSNLNTISTAAVGNSGNILINLSSNLVIGSISQNSTNGNVGTLAFNNVYNSTVGGITRTASSAVNNTTLGDFSIANCENIIFVNPITMSIVNPASTGVINAYVGRSNQSIMFSSTVNLLGCTTGARSDVGLDLQFINCVFNNQLNVNNAGTFITERGGWIKRLDIQDCKFYHRARFVNWPINPQTTDPIIFDLSVNVKDCTFAKGVVNAGFYFQNNDVSYTYFEIKNCQSDDPQVGIGIGMDPTTPPVVTFMLDGAYIDLQNIKSSLSVSTMDPVLNSATFNCIVSNCNGSFGAFETWEDFNFQFNMCNYESTLYSFGFGTIPLTKSFYINNSRMGATPALGNTINGGGIGTLDFVIKNSYFGFYTDILNPMAVSTSAVYNSFIESVADVGSTSSFTGTLFTSTIRRLVTEIVAGLTLNNSYDDPY